MGAARSKADSLTRRGAPKDYPPEFGEAFETLGIVLGSEDFDQKMEALKGLTENPLPVKMKLAVIALEGASLKEQDAWEYLLTYYENKERDGATLHQ